MQLMRTRRRLVLSLGVVLAILGTAAAHEIFRRLQASAPTELVTIGFDAQEREPTDAEVRQMIDRAVGDALGPKGLAAIISPGDKVVVKVNIVEPSMGAYGEKGRGIITDPRVVRHVAERVREIIGAGGTADLKVVDALYSSSTNPSEYPGNGHSFAWARLERTGDNTVDPEDVCYDCDHGGVLDGASSATLVNLDALGPNERFQTTVHQPSLGAVDISMPKFLRTRQQAAAAGEPDEYCDVHISIPVFKTHRMPGITCAMKNHYGYCPQGDRGWHGGATMSGETPVNAHLMDEYLVAQHLVRGCDFIIVDCLTGHGRGPNVPGYSRDGKAPYILVHAVMAGADSIAIDTVAALLAGYDPRTVEFLERGRIEGLGEDQPAWIRLAGLDRFSSHRRFLLDAYGEEPDPYGGTLYPFPDGIGGARRMFDFAPPSSVTISTPALLADDTYAFPFSAREEDADDLGLARVELLIDGALANFQNEDLSSSGTFLIDMSDFTSGTHACRIAAWDRSLNCALSPELPFTAPARAREPIRAMIRSFYRLILGRDPELGAVDAWHGGYFDYAVSFNIDVRFIPREMARLIFLSEEYATRGRANAEFIADCYNVFLARDPSATELANWTGGIWNRSEVMTIFSESEEFATRIDAIYPNLGGDAARNLVTTMYVGLLDRLVDKDGLEYAATVFDGANAQGGLEAVRAQAKQMAREVLASEEFLGKDPQTADYVVRLYRSFLGRFPNDSEAAYWSAELDSGGQTLGGLIERFAESQEFTARLEQYFGKSSG